MLGLPIASNVATATAQQDGNSVAAARQRGGFLPHAIANPDSTGLNHALPDGRPRSCALQSLPLHVPATVQLLLNVSAGSIDAPAAGRIRELASQHGVTVIECQSGDELEQAARRAVDNAADLVMAAGGDGTISTIAAILAGTHIPLGVLPLGTLNHFAKDLGIPLEIDEAMQLLANGRVIDVDIARVNDRVFINNSGLGLYPYMVHHREAVQRRGWSKWTAAFLASMRALARYRMLRLHVSVDGVRIFRRTPAVFIGNNEYRLDVGVEPRRLTLQDGKLCLYIPRAQSRWELIRFSVRALFGRRHHDSALDMFLTDSFTIRSRHRHLRVSMDGETQVMTTPLEYSTWPGALRVLVPEASSSTARAASS